MVNFYSGQFFSSSISIRYGLKKISFCIRGFDYNSVLICRNPSVDLLRYKHRLRHTVDLQADGWPKTYVCTHKFLARSGAKWSAKEPVRQLRFKSYLRDRCQPLGPTAFTDLPRRAIGAGPYSCYRQSSNTRSGNQSNKYFPFINTFHYFIYYLQNCHTNWINVPVSP